MSELKIVFPSCGGRAGVLVAGGAGADRAAHDVRRLLASWERRLTRFDPLSELSRVNGSRATHLRVSELMLRFTDAAIDAAATTHGLVDPTMVGAIESAGYATGRARRGLPLELALRLAPRRASGAPDPAAHWSHIRVDHERGVISRPCGVKLDSGGIAKGLFADMAADMLTGFGSWTVDVCGDLRIGGAAHRPRTVRVESPFDKSIVHELKVIDGGVATSGIGKRAWLTGDGKPAHHLLNPATGMPAYTGIVQATALAPTAVEAEALAKAALLAGPDEGRRWLPHGGVLVFDDRSHAVVEPQRSAPRGAVAA